MDPVTVGTIAGMILKTLELVHKRREGSLAKAEAQELYSRIYCSLLWEIQQNMNRCANMVKQAKEGSVSAGVLSFFVRDALFSDFCIMCPEPKVIAELNAIYSALERIHHWQRVTYSMQGEGVRYILGFADAMFFSSKSHDKFNQLVDSLSELASDIELPPKVVAPNKSLHMDGS